jgi:hypothetical protein
MHDYTITGLVMDTNNKPINNIMVQVMDSDQKWFEDHNDDIIESKWVNEDGTFEMFIDKESFKDGLFEGKPEFYLIIRNSLGEVIHITEPKKEDKNNRSDNSSNNLLHIEISLVSTEKKAPEASPDPYAANNERVITAFQRLGDVSEFRLKDIAWILRLLETSINAWSSYTTDHTWKIIGYDGPQVPRYPWRVPGHSHKLSWEGGPE